MKKLFFILCFCALSAFGQSPYYGVRIDSSAGTAEGHISGVWGVAKNADAAGAYSITLDGTAPLIKFAPSTEYGFKIMPEVSPNRLSVKSVTSGADTTRLIINENGNVGIGVSPSAKFHIAGTMREDFTSSAASSGVTIYDEGGAFVGGFEGFGTAYPTSALRQSLAFTNSFDNNGFITFRTKTSGVINTRAVIKNNGNFGLGTETPTEKLHIKNGNIKIEGTSGTHGLEFPDGTKLLSAANIVPSGSIMAFAGSAAPSGWFLCDGSAVSRTTYSVLFGIIGITYGAGDGSTTFNVPDMRGRMPLGKDNMGGTGANRAVSANAGILGGSGGEENHTLTVAEIPSHNHQLPLMTARIGLSAAPDSFDNANSNDADYQNTENAGGGGAHNNMPPYITLNYIIKY